MRHRLRCDVWERTCACCKCGWAGWRCYYESVIPHLVLEIHHARLVSFFSTTKQQVSSPFRWPPPVEHVVLRKTAVVAHPLFRHCRQGFHRITTRLGGTANLNTGSSSQQSFLWTHEGLSRGNPVVQVRGAVVVGLLWCTSPSFAVTKFCVGQAKRMMQRHRLL